MVMGGHLSKILCGRRVRTSTGTGTACPAFSGTGHAARAAPSKHLPLPPKAPHSPGRPTARSWRRQRSPSPPTTHPTRLPLQSNPEHLEAARKAASKHEAAVGGRGATQPAAARLPLGGVSPAHAGEDAIEGGEPRPQGSLQRDPICACTIEQDTQHTSTSEQGTTGGCARA